MYQDGLRPKVQITSLSLCKISLSRNHSGSHPAHIVGAQVPLWVNLHVSEHLLPWVGASCTLFLLPPIGVISISFIFLRKVLYLSLILALPVLQLLEALRLLLLLKIVLVLRLLTELLSSSFCCHFNLLYLLLLVGS